MRTVEDAFADHVEAMHKKFDEKAKAFELIESQVETNHRFMEDHFIKMQQKMNEKYSLIKVQKDAFEQEVQEIKDRIKIDGEILSLNIGGTHHISTE